MNLAYLKLNDYDYARNTFPHIVAGVFNDGVNRFAIILPLQGEVVMVSSKPIMEADRELLEFLGINRFPGDIVVTDADALFEYGLRTWEWSIARRG